MSEIDIDKIGLKVGLEIHQQLDTSKKLFCNCKPIENTEYTEKFTRKLRAAKSELGLILLHYLKVQNQRQLCTMQIKIVLV